MGDSVRFAAIRQSGMACTEAIHPNAGKAQATAAPMPSSISVPAFGPQVVTAAELAERGFVTFAPNYPKLAKYQPDLEGLGWESGTLKAVWDNIRGLDLLTTLPGPIIAVFGIGQGAGI